MDKYYEDRLYRRNRVAEYPQEWRDQLEMLWKDIDNGFFGEEAKGGSWYMMIKDIKDRYPPPEGFVDED